MTNKQLAEQLHNVGISLFDKTNDPNLKLLLDEASDRLVKQSEWISVDKKLPDRQCEVLAYYGFLQEDCYIAKKPIKADDLGYMMMGVLTYFAHDFTPHFQHESTGLRVTHWMPLPEPPEGDIE